MLLHPWTSCWAAARTMCTMRIAGTKIEGPTWCLRRIGTHYKMLGYAALLFTHICLFPGYFLVFLEVLQIKTKTSSREKFLFLPCLIYSMPLLFFTVPSNHQMLVAMSTLIVTSSSDVELSLGPDVLTVTERIR